MRGLRVLWWIQVINLWYTFLIHPKFIVSLLFYTLMLPVLTPFCVFMSRENQDAIISNFLGIKMPDYISNKLVDILNKS